MKSDIKRAIGFAVALLSIAFGADAGRAEATRVRIVDSLGLTHLPIWVAVEEKFIQKEADKLGLHHIDVSFQRVGSGVVVGQLLIAGQADLGVSGNVPMFIMADRTSGKQKIRGVMALAKSNQFLLTIDPKIKTIKDYGANDRIAMPEAKASTYAMTLEIAAAKAFGPDQRNRFESNAVSMSNSDAAAEMLSGEGLIKSHFTVLPYTALELASHKVRVVLNSKDVIGYPYTSTAAISTEGFRERNPILYQAVVNGMLDSIKFIQEHPVQAAKLYMASEKYPGGVGALVKMIKGETPDELSFSPVPKGTKTFTDVMFQDSILRTRPASWRNEWFDSVWNMPGD